MDNRRFRRQSELSRKTTCDSQRSFVGFTQLVPDNHQAILWLIRQFTTDLTEYVAATRAPASAVRLDPALRRRLGVGNSTGLGLGPFIVNHPALFDRWLTARETALARVRNLPEVGAYKNQTSGTKKPTLGGLQ